jgi:hypothetical protein
LPQALLLLLLVVVLLLLLPLLFNAIGCVCVQQRVVHAHSPWRRLLRWTARRLPAVRRHSSAGGDVGSSCGRREAVATCCRKLLSLQESLEVGRGVQRRLLHNSVLCRAFSGCSWRLHSTRGPALAAAAG